MAPPTTDWSKPELQLVVPGQITKTIHTEVYDAISPANPANSAKGKIVVITGGATGIGLAAAKVWLEAGAEGLTIAGRRQDKLDEALAELQSNVKAGSKVIAVKTDVTVEQDTQNLYAQIKAAFGRLPDIVIANAGVAGSELTPLANEPVKEWWKSFETNLYGLHNTVHSFINAQADPKKPVGTVININSGAAGLLIPGVSSYAIGKLAAHRYMDYLTAEYPTLRTFIMHPGTVKTAMTADAFAHLANDAPDMAGGWTLYLSRPEADYLKGSFVSVNWDISELKPHKDRIEKENLLKMSWIPILPMNGGKGLMD